MILLLLGLEILALFRLLCVELLLLLLESHVVLGVAGVWSGRTLRGRNILGMDSGAGRVFSTGGGRLAPVSGRAVSLVGCATSLVGRAASLFGRVVSFAGRALLFSLAV